MGAVKYTVIFLLPAAVLQGAWLGGAWTFLAVGVAFGALPVLDALVGLDTRNPDAEAEARLADSLPYRAVTWLVAPVQAATLLGAVWWAAQPERTWLERVGIAVSVGVSGGAMGITVAHELVHRVNLRLEPALGQALLCMVSYMHWGLEHVAGHHRHVATPADPATARRGQSVYAFWFQTVFGTLRSAARLHAERQARRKRRPWGIRNGFVWCLILPAALATALGLWLGAVAVMVFAIQSFVAISLLEVVNYVEHYGLERREIAPGRYERVTPVHSWNASHRLTNWFLFMLQRHSDHHANPGRRYPVLRHFEEAPQLPAGYATMVLLALVPPLWFRVMDARLPDRGE